ncbi:AAA family ATPase [Marinomonas gallaica]|uniref:AAA family ATPase n=1 Tax=Marinomonas gallaica TaxID=1806667 RepID=UPI003A8E9B84
MIKTIAIENYRSIINLTIPLGRLNLVTGENGSGKSNLYKALRLLAKVGDGGLVRSLAEDGGLESVFWAGPEKITKRMRSGEVPVQGGPRQTKRQLKLGFAAEDYGYSVALGLPKFGVAMPVHTPPTQFKLDPGIMRETIWHGEYYRPASALIDRQGSAIKRRVGRSWEVVSQHASSFDSMFDLAADAQQTPEVFFMRDRIRKWRFYDHFRTDQAAPARQHHLGTFTPVLNHDGRDVAAAIQTIIEIGDAEALHDAIDYAFPGARVEVVRTDEGRFMLQFYQHGLLRPLNASELSDGTLRYVLWVAALLTPRPPELMVLNEPETSLHPDLLPALARLISFAADHCQVWVVSHASRLIAALEQSELCHSIRLEKDFGETQIPSMGMLDLPPWHWPS